MPTRHDTNSGGSSSRLVHFSLRDWATLVGILGALLTGAMFVMGLMYYDRSKGEHLEGRVDNHVAEDNKRNERQDKDIVTLEDKDDRLIEILHRIELKQERLAPKARRDSLPDDLRTPARQR